MFCGVAAGASGSRAPADMRVTYFPSGDHDGKTVVKIPALMSARGPSTMPGCQIVNVELLPGFTIDSGGPAVIGNWETVPCVFTMG